MLNLFRECFKHVGPSKLPIAMECRIVTRQLPVALISQLQFEVDCVYDRGGRVKLVINVHSLKEKRSLGLSTFNTLDGVFGLRTTVDVMEAI
jgi:hypothetical protein